MGDVNFKIDPEASVFRDDAYFDGPGAQKYHFWRKRLFWKIFFKHIFLKIFSGHFFSKKMSKNIFRENGVGVSLLGGGSGPKKYSSDWRPDLKKLFWSRNGSPWELWNCTGVSFAGNFKPRPILSSNRPQIATFELLFYFFWSFFFWCFFWVGGMSEATK